MLTPSVRGWRRRASQRSAPEEERIGSRSFGWYEAPPPGSLEHAEGLLASLGALDGSRLTPLGRRLADLPVHPRLGRALLEAKQLGVLATAATAAALAEGREVLHRDTAADPDSGADNSTAGEALMSAAAGASTIASSIVVVGLVHVRHVVN